MPRSPLWFLPCLGLPTLALAADVVVGPYLQEATPTSVHVRWETDAGEESRLEWGTTEALGSSEDGIWWGSGLGQTLHEVELAGLQADTRYWYRVHTGDAAAGPFAFSTPPESGPLRLVAFSDVQRDGGNPDVFGDLIAEGLLPWLAEDAASVDAVLVPGDLVDNGWDYGSWAEEFFAPGAPLFRSAALYPVPGNHEADSPTFFEYFRLPENGSPGFEEHWWSHPLGNVLLVGLDSNSGYAGSTQLDWLDSVLDGACADDAVDFVLAQLHHPFKSELWLPGESFWSGSVVERLEAFSTRCGKPSVHLFGHTHGYSRGQSRDHRHLWVNVATAGGNIDYWGEYAQQDYPEFVTSQDEWGFAVLDVTAGDDPSLRLRRLSRGDEFQARLADLTDEVLVRRHESAPPTPEALSPRDEEVDAEAPVLVASAYAGADLGASHFQVGRGCDFGEPVVDVWRQHRNEYEDRDLMEGVDLGELVIDPLPGLRDYCWRVRYRSQGLVWGEWSAPASFRTGESQWTEQLLANPGAEDGVEGWVVDEGQLESLADAECDSVPPRSGERLFSVGGNCEPSSFARVHQDIGLVLHQAAVDDGRATVRLGGWLRTWGGDDVPTLQAHFLDPEGELLGSTSAFATQATTWTEFEEDVAVPPGTRLVRVELTGTRNAGEDNDSYVDDVSLRLRTELGSAGDDDDSAEPTPAGCGCAASVGGVGSQGMSLMLLLLLGLRRRQPSSFERSAASSA